MNGVRERPRLATVCFGGCSGCHMSILDMDERLLELTAMADLVYSPFMDVKRFPMDVDVTLVEGAIANADHLQQIGTIRERTRVLVALGDCAVTGNVTALRNPLGAAAVLRRVYGDDAAQPRLPRLLDQVEPLNARVHVDVHVPGCPPSASLILSTVRRLLTGTATMPASGARFG